ncbi:MAG: hypothetical protein J7539_02405 [Niabella sp.]|nr:hypothetical protein [Niabella sp.]
MKRNTHLVPLSREHHYGLLFCWKIRQGVTLKVAAARIVPYVRYFYETHLRQHFHEEEATLFTNNDPYCQRALTEHKEIVQRVLQLTENEPDAAALISFADLLDAHIRYEERVAFPYLEQNLSQEQLDTIGNALRHLPTDAAADTYPDPFWISTKN